MQIEGFYSPDMEVPDLLCGGAKSKKRKSGRVRQNRFRRQRIFRAVKPGSSGGAITSLRKGPKAGNRVRSQAAFQEAGDGKFAFAPM